MKLVDINIDIYKWEGHLLLMEYDEDSKELLDKLKFFELPEDDIEYLEECLKEKPYDGGEIYTNSNRLIGVIVLYPQTTLESLIDCLTHETSHLTDKILKSTRIEDGEAEAYLHGYIMKQLTPVIREWIE